MNQELNELKELVNLRKYYTPIQPSVRVSTKGVTYLEALPHFQLQPFIYCYWELTTLNKLDEQFNYKVVADGCIDIFFEINNCKESFVMGFCKKFAEFAIGHEFRYIGIRFLPSMFPQVFEINASILSNKFQNLENIIPDLAQFICYNFNAHDSIEEIKIKLDNCLIWRISKIRFNYDKRFYDALIIIFKTHGVLNIEANLNTGISVRQLRRLFEFYIGDSAKTFAKVVRFQNILNAKPSLQSLRKNKLFYDGGYYDQAHFIKEFKKFYGVTPTEAFRRY